MSYNSLKEYLFESYEKMLKKQGNVLIDRITDELISNLQNIKRDSDMMLSPEDSSLENFWEEFCVQIRGEESFYFEAYCDYIRRIIQQHLDSVSYFDEFCIYTTTDEYDDAIFKMEDDEIEGEVVLDTEAVENALYSDLYSKADDFYNDNIEKYLYSDDETDDYNDEDE